jgi:hypothetical protein
MLVSEPILPHIHLLLVLLDAVTLLTKVVGYAIYNNIHSPVIILWSALHHEEAIVRMIFWKWHAVSARKKSSGLVVPP